MATSDTITAIPADVMADVQAIADAVAAGRPIDPEIARRVHERAVRIRQEVFHEHGVLDIGVAAVREFRGEIPDS